MHKHHLAGCGLALAAAVIIFAVTGGSTGGLGLVLAALICPIAMGAVMWFLMGSQRGQHTERRADDETSHHEATSTP